MSAWKRLLIFKLIVKLALLSFLTPLNALAQALPAPEPQKVSRAVSGVLQDGMRNRGFASNDPRFWKTLSSVGGRATAAGAGAGAAVITAGVITAPAWVSIAVAAAIGAVVTYGVTLAIDGLVEWLFNDDGTIDFQMVNSAPTLPGFTAGEQVWRGYGANGEVFGTDHQSVANQVRHDDVLRYVAQGYNFTYSPPTCTLTSGGYACSGNIVLTKKAAPIQCPAGSLIVSGACGAPTYPDALPTPLEQDGATVPAAVGAIPSEDLNKPLNPVILAGLANQLWQQAASQPGYDGLPYPQNDPITAAEVEPWIQANPTLAPTVGDFVAPNPVTTANPTPWVLPSNPTAPVTTPVTETNPGTTNPAEENPLTNLGPDPGIGAPDLESTPTAQQILDPILNMLPGHRSFTASSHEGTCPTPTINLYGAHTMDAHCTLIDQNKGVIQGAMTFAWAVIALFIVLSA